MLPIIDEREEKEFSKICEEELGLKLNGQEALEAAPCVLQISYLRQYGLTGEQRQSEFARLFCKKEGPYRGELPR